MRENFGHGWVNRGPRRMTDFDDLPRNAGKHWDYYEDEPMDKHPEAW